MAAEDPKYLEFWEKTWHSENPPFATPEKHLWLVKGSNVDYLLRGRQNQKIFFPLCGNAVDMKWMGDLGHRVVGVDLGDTALEGFFKKNEIPYTSEPSEKCGGTLFKSNDDKYKLYGCDFFKFGKELEDGFDALFDSGSLVAIHGDMREKSTIWISGVRTERTLRRKM